MCASEVKERKTQNQNIRKRASGHATSSSNDGFAERKPPGSEQSGKVHSPAGDEGRPDHCAITAG